jgi:flagella basal body P-ring formation protein FlgA
VVYVTSSFGRGHRLRHQDLETRPLPAAEIDADPILDRAAAVGMELRRSVRSDQPLTHRDIGLPILIRRGDRLEVRVVQGGITVSTTARALEDGAESETIEVQIEGASRKRLLARVIQSGMVEIVTRAQRVAP